MDTNARRTHRKAIIAPLTVAAAGLLAVACGPTTTTTGTATPTSGASAAPHQLIQPMTTVTEHPHDGYFSDPYPIHVASEDASALPQSLSGSTKGVLTCKGDSTTDCQEKGLTVTTGSDLTQQAAADGSEIKVGFNYNIFQDDSGAWQMAATYNVRSKKFPKAKTWTAILHAHPTVTIAGQVPTNWITDALLVGTFKSPTKADYDGKYFETDGKLYLVYSDRLTNKPAHDGIVAQEMLTPTLKAPDAPTVLLAPGDYNSELFFGLHQPNTFKLIETGNITEVDGKFVMAYSTGAFDEPDYKIGLAWSDTFLPTKGSTYRKVTTTDTAGVWGRAGQPEVKYLLQSQLTTWPDYVGQTVTAPGVPAVVNDGQHWYLTFAGYLPSNAPTNKSTGHFIPSFRRPYYIPLSVSIPQGASAATTPEADLANWMTADKTR
jgi:hypothetical protein